MTVPATMRAVLLVRHGGYECLDVRDDVHVPQPAKGQVLIRVAAAGVNNTDINTRIGWYSKDVAEATGTAIATAGADGDAVSWSGEAFQFPRIQGADACGRIVAVGAGIDANRIGERVLVEPAFRQDDPYDIQYFGSEVDGAFADFTCVPAQYAHCVESELTDVELASFPCAYSTAENILTRVGLRAGERVLVTGASGGVGSAAVQLAKRRGAEVIALVGGDKADAVRALGAEMTLPRDADLRAHLGVEHVDVVVDIVGGGGFGCLLDILKKGGRYGVSGAIAGPMVELDLRTLYLKDLSLFGCTVLAPEVFGNLVSYIERGEIKPCVAATYPLDQIVAAQEDFLTKRHVGKIVLTL